MAENIDDDKTQLQNDDSVGDERNGLRQGFPEFAGDSNNAVINRRALIWLDLAALIGVFFVAQKVGSFLGGLILNNSGSNFGFATFVANLITFAVTITFALWLRDRRGAPKPLLKLSLKKTNPGLVLWGFVLLMVSSIVLEPLLQLFPVEGIERVYELIGDGWWAVITTVILAPVLEEVLFRGIIQQSLTEQFGGWRSVILTSTIFALVHLMPQQMVNAFFAGIILGYIYIKTQSIVPVMLIHALNNAMAFIQMKVFGTESLVTVRQLIGNDTVYWIVYGIFGAIFIVALMNLWQQLGAIPARDGAKEEEVTVQGE